MCSKNNIDGVLLDETEVLDNTPQSQVEQAEPTYTQNTNPAQEPIYIELDDSVIEDRDSKQLKRLVRKRKFREVKRNVGYVLTIVKTTILIVVAIFILSIAVNDGVRGRIVKSVETVAHTVDDWFNGKYTTEKGKTTKDYVDDLVKDLDKTIGYEEK